MNYYLALAALNVANATQILTTLCYSGATLVEAGANLPSGTQSDSDCIVLDCKLATP